ncbi:MAG: acetolactate decarboxylase [Pedobacter sp.]
MQWMRLKTAALTAILLMFCCLPAVAGQDTLVQVSTIDALLSGLYDGTMTIAELRQSGGFGIGTFDRLNGEMVMLDGIVYRVRSDGKVDLVPDTDTTPFAAVTFFESELRRDIPSGSDFLMFQQWLDSLLPNLNLFYAVRIEGHFRVMKTRSVPQQVKPYPALAEVARHQPEFEFEDVEGVIVGYRSPAFVKGIGVPGYHLHFLTSDRKAGGHILAFTVQQATVDVDQTSEILLRLPESKAFGGVDLGQDRSADLKQVEQER